MFKNGLLLNNPEESFIFNLILLLKLVDINWVSLSVKNEAENNSCDHTICSCVLFYVLKYSSSKHQMWKEC